MMEWVKKEFSKGRDIILYGIFGVLTTVLNIISYWIMAHVFGFSTFICTVVAWFIAVLFAYITNRKWVFHSNTAGSKDILKEICTFFSCRLMTGFIDLGCMFLFVDVFHLNDMVIKTGANLLVITMNYVASKFLIFK